MRYLVVLFLLLTFTSQGEPFYPVLNKAAADNLRRKLRQSSPDTNRVKFLLALSNDFVSRASDTERRIDTAAAYIAQAQELSEKLCFVTGQIDSKYALAYYLLGRNQKQEAAKAARSGLASSQQRNDAYRQAIGWYLLGAIQVPSETNANILSELAQRLENFEKAVHFFHAAYAPQMEARSLKEIADTHLQEGKLPLARQELLQVLALYQRSGYPNVHYTLDLLGYASTLLGDYPNALQYRLAAIQSAKRTEDTSVLGFFYGRAGDIYGHLHQPEKAITYYQLALQSAERNQSSFEITEHLFGLVRTYILINKPREALDLLQRKSRAYPPQDDHARLMLADGLVQCYLSLKEYSQAKAPSEQLEALVETDAIKGNHYLLARAWKTIGKYHLATKHFAKAELALIKAYTSIKQVGNVASLANTCLLIFQADSAQGHLLPAIAYYKQYKLLNDSIFNKENRRQMTLLRSQNETEKREQRIALLTKQTQVQQANIGRQQTQRNAILASAILLSLLLGVSYNRYLIKQRSNQLLETKQLEIDHKNQTLEQVLEEKDGLLVEKEWMLKEIHHRVKNNLQIVNELLSSQVDYLRDPQTLSIVRESQNRIQAMALIHQKLYQSQSLTRVDMQEYIHEIVEHLVLSFDDQDSVGTFLQVSAVELDVSVATPLGLIINEAVTNSLKYAFPGGRTGTITISLTQEAGRYHLLLTDDGIGLPSGLDITTSRTMGLVMIRGLSEQLNATLAFERGAGTRISLSFAATRKPTSPAQVAQPA